mgnify:CR=1 FL=1
MRAAKRVSTHTHIAPHHCTDDVCMCLSSDAANDKPPASDTGAELTIHWLRGGFDSTFTHEEVLGLVQQILPDSYIESPEWGQFMYKRHHMLTNGIRIYFEPSADNMPPVLLECPGEACEVLGFDNLRILFCNAELTRSDIAFDRAPFTPRDVASWVREGNIRTRAKSRRFFEDLSNTGEGETVYIGSRQSEQLLRVYDRRGFTRVELELKGEMARSFKEILLLDSDHFSQKAVGVLREFIDFVDAEKDSNVSRAPLLALWEEFTKNLSRVKIRATGIVTQTLETVKEWLEFQVSAMLHTYAKAGGSVGQLLKLGEGRLKRKHRLLIASAGVVNGLS